MAKKYETEKVDEGVGSGKMRTGVNSVTRPVLTGPAMLNGR